MRTRIVAAAAIALLATASFATADSSPTASAKAEWLAHGSPATPVVPLAPSAPISADSSPSITAKASWLAHGSAAAPAMPLAAGTPGNIWDNGAANGLDGLSSERDTSVSGTDGPTGQDFSDTADDFEITEPTTITEIRACFLTTASTRAHLTIYTDSGSGGSPALPVTAPLWGAPTTAAITTDSYNDSTARCPDAWGYIGREFVFSPATTGISIHLTPGHYWLSVVGDGQGNASDRDFWATSTPVVPLANGVIGSTTLGYPFWTDASTVFATPPQFAFDIDGYGSEHIWDNGAANELDGVLSVRDALISGTGGPTGQDAADVADDFEITEPTTLTEIRVCLLTRASTRAHLTIYEDSGIGSPALPVTAPLWGAPTTAAITTDTYHDYNDGTARCPDNFGYTGREFVFSPATTGVAINLAPGHYWLLVVGDGQGDTSDTDFWATSSPSVPLAHGVVGSTYFGYPFWTDVATVISVPPQFAFYIDGYVGDSIFADGFE